MSVSANQKTEPMEDEITVADLDFILESLNYSRYKFESIDYIVEYGMTPEQAAQHKRERLEKTAEVTRKVQLLKTELKKMG